MKFHHIHSVNVKLDETRTNAQRRGSSFCDSFVFSESSLKLNSYLSIKFISSDSDWKGQAFIGLTTQNPSMFIDNAYSKYIIHLLDAEDVWIRSILEQWKNCNLILHLTFDGSLEVISEHEAGRKYVLFQNLPVNIPLWLVVELYGSTQQIELPIFKTTNSPEIVSLCTDANVVFRCGQKGVVPYSRSRIVITGPPDSGKNRLKKILLQKLIHEDNESVQMVESEGNGKWNFFTSDTPTKQKMSEIMLTDEYRHIAQNLIREITLSQQNREAQNENSVDLIKNLIKFPRILPKSRTQYSKEVKQQFSENPIPDELLKIVEDILNKNSAENETDTPATDTSHKHLINLCDFRGNLLYLLINQFFFTSEALYLFVFDLSKDLRQIIPRIEDYSIGELYEHSVSYIDVLHQWLSLIHTSIASFRSTIDDETNSSPDDSTLTIKPRILLVGTHKKSLKSPEAIDDIFKHIFNEIGPTVYGSHLCKNYAVLELESGSIETETDNKDLLNLKKIIDELFEKERSNPLKIPLAWIQLGATLDKFRQRGIFFVDINHLHEVVSSQNELFQSYDNLSVALNFLHNQSRIFYLDCVGQQANSDNDRIVSSYDLGVIILDPQWFLSCIYELCDHLSSLPYDDDNAQFGVIQESVINAAWSSCIDQKFILLGCLENLDIICELNPYIQLEDGPDVASTANNTTKLYFFPWVSKWDPEHTTHQEMGNNPLTGTSGSGSGSLSETSQTPNFFENDLNFIFYANFSVLPLSLFTRLMVRITKWSWSQGWGRKPEMYQAKCRVAVDFDHDMILRISLKQNRITVTVIKIFEELHNDHMENYFVGPGANVCVKVHNLVESELESLKNIYYRRLSFKLTVRCPCDAQCLQHHVDACNEEECLHFLSLNDCLQKKVVECVYNRQIRTAFVQRFLPVSPNIINVRLLPFDERVLKDDVLFEAIYTQTAPEGWDMFQVEPLWMREAAKLLNSNQFTNDWIALGKRLSYTDRDINKFADEISPALTLLKNWYESNGRTRYCIDVLISCLRMLAREDIASLIEYELEPDNSIPPIFLSYQRESQKQVLEIRRKLEMSGFPCWMDTALMGGENLYGKIYEGISRSKVFISCLTPRYVASVMCQREVSLADGLHKPIIPLIIEPIPWPPPGPMALALSSMVYVDLCGVGSHSGIGRTQDIESKFREILDKVARYLSGYHDMPIVPSRYLQLADFPNTRRHEHSPRRTLSGEVLQHERRRQSVTQISDYRSVRSDTNHSVGSPTIDSEHDDYRNPSGNNTTVFDSNRNINSINNDSSIIERSQNRNNQPGMSTDMTFTSQIVADDELSVMSRPPIANRITNCTVCVLM